MLYSSGNETLEEDSHHENTGVNFDGPAAGNDAGGSSHPTTAVHSRNGSTEIPKGVRPSLPFRCTPVAVSSRARWTTDG